MSIRHVSPVPRRSASGRVAEVYAQSTADFGQAALMMLSPAPELHAAAWAVLRESELAGLAPRTDKEVVAVAVSLANGCRFCIDAHTILIHALGEHQLAEDLLHDRTPADQHRAALVTWAKATRTLHPADLASPPFRAELAAEYIGTALSTHFVNRMFSTLTDERLLPGDLQRAQPVRRAGALAYTRTVHRELGRGDSLPLLAGIPTAPSPLWAGETPMATAFAALRGAAAAGATLLSEQSRLLLRAAVAEPAATGAQPHGPWLRQRLARLPEADRPAARLALLAALAPHDVTEADVAAWRATTGATDADLVRLLGYGAMTAVDRIEEAITSPAPTR
ncbi:carboxymuconolactone decarboxylase family protein [Nonomuraea sp. SMC257]|uniref:Carboxymuconolactone decarboxylase family protein n=1 Tax=Nonomuraea montanisoli TaxID=2741721 RepID=A0A7Y6I8Y5_9ACTN|nr:carboxymuconolactone decarboxylase family protein [Nonomuraea montanisoli]NUW33882.1 carboxymuconolactone decarboxylase family protein [Nonomuraea montanisoli]